MSENIEQVRKALNWRYATKAYDKSRKISADDWQLLEDALLLAPASYGLQEHKVIIVEDADLREKLRAASWGQPQVTDASHFVVFAAKTDLGSKEVAQYIDRIVDVRGTPREDLEQFEGMINAKVGAVNDAGLVTEWNARQAYIALGFFLETAAILGIDASPMEGFDPAQYDEILGLEGYTAVVVAAAGYRDEAGDWLAPLAKVRWKKEDFFERR